MPIPVVAFDETQSWHTSYGHPENHQRLAAVIAHLANAGILDKVDLQKPQAADWEIIERVHSRSYLAQLRAAKSDRTIWLDPDTYFTPQSLDIALRAAGGSILCVDEVASNSSKVAFALPRPPGHHATRDTAMGFCLFNHIAVGAQRLMEEHGVERIAIVDFDVHHGNGTQDIFYDNPDVLFLSVHESPLFPGTGAASETGGANAEGCTVNVPLPAGCGDTIYQMTFRQIFEPVLSAFQPEFLLVSAGYDAHWRDPLANMVVTISGFAELMRILLEWADTWTGGKLVAYLEGGYDLEMLPPSVAATLQLMLNPDSEVIDPIGKGGKKDREAGTLLDKFLR
jgi:acetoin utilization deacetylase AcuC-like enzyme